MLVEGRAGGVLVWTLRAACVCCSCVYACSYYNILNVHMHDIGDRAVGWINSSKLVCSIQTCWCCFWPCEYVCMWCPELLLWYFNGCQYVAIHHMNDPFHCSSLRSVTMHHTDDANKINHILTYPQLHTHAYLRIDRFFILKNDSDMVGTNDGILRKKNLLFFQDMCCNLQQPSSKQYGISIQKYVNFWKIAPGWEWYNNNKMGCMWCGLACQYTCWQRTGTYRHYFWDTPALPRLQGPQVNGVRDTHPHRFSKSTRVSVCTCVCLSACVLGHMYVCTKVLMWIHLRWCVFLYECVCVCMCVHWRVCILVLR